MRNRLLGASVRTIVILLACTFTFPVLGMAVEFSADFVVHTKDEGDMTGKIYIKGNKVRQEYTEEGETQIMIVRPDKGVTWIVTPEEKIYMEVPHQSDTQAFEEWSPEKEKNAKLVGEETVSGFQTKKYEIMEEGDKVTYWVAKDLSFPIKMEVEDTTMEYKNIKKESIADAIFEVPAGYKKEAMPMMPEGEEEKE